MIDYELIGHTADAEFRAYGKTLEEAFKNSAKAMYAVLIDPKEIKSKITHKIHVESENRQALLYDFLEEFIVLMDVEGFMLHDLEVHIDEKNGGRLEIDAVVTGDVNTNYKISGDIKAVTYNDMKIEEKKGIWMCQVVVDI